MVAFALGAQAPASAQLSVGFKGGMSTATFNGSRIGPTDWMRGYAGGVFATYVLVDELSFQPEALFQQKGAKVALAGDGTGSSSTVHLDYVGLVMLLRVDVPLLDGAAALYMVGGPSGSVNVRCAVTAPRAGTTAELDCAASGVDMAVRTLDFAMVGGGGLRARLNGAAVFIEGTYAAGFGAIDSGSADWNRTNQALAVMAGVSFPLPPHVTVAARR
jgi:opacity protein-like surface antigen